MDLSRQLSTTCAGLLVISTNSTHSSSGRNFRGELIGERTCFRRATDATWMCTTGEGNQKAPSTYGREAPWVPQVLTPTPNLSFGSRSCFFPLPPPAVAAATAVTSLLRCTAWHRGNQGVPRWQHQGCCDAPQMCSCPPKGVATPV